MKRNLFKAIKTFFAAATILSIAACNNLSVDSEEEFAASSGKDIKVTLNLTTPSRTILPKVNLSEYAYRLSYKASSAETATIESVSLSDSKLSLTLEAGTYDFTVNGYAKTDTGFATAILTGSAKSVDISTSPSISIKLTAATGGSGNLSVTLKVSSELGVTQVNAVLYTPEEFALLTAAPAIDKANLLESDTTSNLGYTTVTYTADSLASGESKYLVFYMYDASDAFVTSHTETVYVVNGKESSKIISVDTATYLATVSVKKDGSAWNNDDLAISLRSSENASDEIAMSYGSNGSYTANVPAGKYYVFVGDIYKEKTLTITDSAASTDLSYTSTSVFPNIETTAAYADTYLEITFDSAPTINRASDGSVRIYDSSDKLIDTIKPAAEKLYGYGVGGNSSYGEINVQYQLIQVIGDKVRIIPHHGNTAVSSTLLENGKSYYVVVDGGLITGTVAESDFTGIGKGEWTFTTGAEPSVSANTLSVGSDKNFITVQGALNYLMKNNKTGDWEIQIDKGTYYERLFYSGKANITMSGQSETKYGTDVEIQWTNQDGGDPSTVTNTLWNYGARGRNVFYYKGGNLVLENLSIINTASRKTNEYGEHDDSGSDTANGNNQAEALLFDSTGTCAAYNCNFASKQDTIYLSPSGGKAWFYACQVSGDVDFIWGLSDVALFENCEIISAYDSDKSSNHTTYVVAPHLPKEAAPYGKGFVLYKSNITVEENQDTYLARSPWGNSGSVSQVAVIDTSVKGGLKGAWSGNHVVGSDKTILGWKHYGVTVDGTVLSADNELSSEQYEAEFAGRRNILNRVYNGEAFEKDSVAYWDISALLSRWNIAECGSKESLSGEAEVTSVVWDFKALTGYSPQVSYVSSVPATSGSGDAIALSDNWKWHGDVYGLTASGSSPWKITVPVEGSCTIAITNSYTQGSPTVVLPSSTTGATTLAANSTEIYAYSGSSAANLEFTLEANGTFYISNVVVTYTSSSSSEPDTSAVASKGNVITDSDTSSLSNVTLSLNDTPVGYASIENPDWPTNAEKVTVSTKADLVKYAKSETPYIIYVDGMIDMSSGMLPSVGGGTTSALDSFVNTTSGGDFTTYPAWQSAYARACNTTTNDKSSSSDSQEGESLLRSMLWKLNDAYGAEIKLSIKSNKIIIGKTAASGIKGGTIQINGESNIQLRNLTIQDAYDPFPHHEKNDGYNAQWDGINIQGTCSHIWIDHCTFEDTLSLAHVYTNGNTDEKWQNYDGLCDIKGNTQYVTVSYCKFKNHDKTMLIGNDDDESTTLGSGDNFTPRQISLHHNYFYNCTQRLPMVRNTNIHIFNNYYHASSAPYDQDYAIGIRYQAKVYSEKNYFSSGIQYSYSGNSTNQGSLWVVDDADESSKKGKGSDSYVIATEAPFTPSYTWTAEDTTNLPTSIPSSAGAGAVLSEE